MGYNSLNKETFVSPISAKRTCASVYRKRKIIKSTVPFKTPKKKFNPSEVLKVTDNDASSSNNKYDIEFDIEKFSYLGGTFVDEEKTEEAMTINELFVFIILLISVIHTLVKYIIALQKKREKKEPYYKKLLNEKNCKFFTNIDKIELFYKLHDKIASPVKRRYRLKSPEVIERKFVTTPKKMGPDRKLVSQDEFLLCMIKLKLGLLNFDLAERL